MKIGQSVWYCKKLKKDTYGEPIEIRTRCNYFTVMGKKPSEDEDWNGQNANYVVDTVDYGNARIKLTLKKVAE